MTACSVLTIVYIPTLVYVGGVLQGFSNNANTFFSVPSLTYSGHIHIFNNNALTYINLNLLTWVGWYYQVSGNSQLILLQSSSILKIVNKGGNALGMDVCSTPNNANIVYPQSILIAAAHGLACDYWTGSSCVTTTC